MNLATLRTLLGKRLQDTVDDQFDDAALNALINVGCGLLQNEIMAVSKHAFIEVATFAQTAGQERYPKPAGIYFPVRLGIADTGAAGGYRKLEKRSLMAATSRATGDDTVWADAGRWLWIEPVPSATVAAGFQLVYVPLVAVSDDADVPTIHDSLHSCIVDIGVIEALGETHETAKAAAERLDRKLKYIQTIYGFTEGFNPTTVGAGPNFRTT